MKRQTQAPARHAELVVWSFRLMKPWSPEALMTDGHFEEV